MRALLDVNVLIALLDSAHVHHALAVRWLTDHIRHGWASCLLTEIGCIRVISQSSYPNQRPAAEVAARLSAAAADPHHAYWPSDASVLDGALIHWNHVLAARQVTDVYLLALAAANKGRLVTFDRHVPIAAARGATADNLVVLN